jgi:RNA-directed DNA polymerase
MKRIGNLYERICSLENLRLADSNARKGKAGSYGVYKHDLQREKNIEDLHQQLLSGSYKTSPYKTFKIYETKEREIFCLPYYPDRIVHWAIMLQLEPIWMAVFTADSYSCIKGRGIHAAARNVSDALKRDPEGTRFCLKLDIKKFYPSVDQNILMQLIERKIKCQRTLKLLSEIIFSIPSGLPIGNYISQYAANLYMTYFDHFVKEDLKVKYYYRYCDDMVFLANEKEFLWSVFVQCQDYLNNTLRLTLKKIYQMFPVDSRGIDFVGYRFFHDHVLLRKRIKQNMIRKHLRLLKSKANPVDYKQGMASFMGWACHSFVSSKNLVKSLQA